MILFIYLIEIFSFLFSYTLRKHLGNLENVFVEPIDIWQHWFEGINSYNNNKVATPKAELATSTVNSEIHTHTHTHTLIHSHTHTLTHRDTLAHSHRARNIN